MSNKYYVYLHKDLHGEVKYVGKGISNRAWITSGRKAEHKAWMESKLPVSMEVEIAQYNLTERQAFSQEWCYIRYHKPEFNSEQAVGRFDSLTEEDKRVIIACPEEDWADLISDGWITQTAITRTLLEHNFLNSLEKINE